MLHTVVNGAVTKGDRCTHYQVFEIPDGDAGSQMPLGTDVVPLSESRRRIKAKVDAGFRGLATISAIEQSGGATALVLEAFDMRTEVQSVRFAVPVKRTMTGKYKVLGDVMIQGSPTL